MSFLFDIHDRAGLFKRPTPKISEPTLLSSVSMETQDKTKILTEVYLCPTCQNPILYWLSPFKMRISGDVARCGTCRKTISKVVIERYNSRFENPACQWPFRPSSYLMFPIGERTVIVGEGTGIKVADLSKTSKRTVFIKK
jgi:hypothetical protein